MSKLKKIICFLIAAFMIVLPEMATINAATKTNDLVETEQGSGFMPSRVMITDYFVEGGGFVSGSVSKVTFTIKNMSKVSNVSSVLLVGWIDSLSPVEFNETNQAYVESISPGEEVEVIFEYYAKNVDMTAIGNVSGGFTIYYSDNALGGNERTNSISINFPVLHDTRTTVDQEFMRWSTPSVSNLDTILSSNLMQVIYVACFIWCLIWIVIMVLFKLGILRYRF